MPVLGLIWRLTGQELGPQQQEMLQDTIRPRDFKYEERGEFLTKRVVKHYNELPDVVKQAKNINIFKNSLDEHRGTPCRSGSRPIAPSLPGRGRQLGPS